MSDNFWKGFLAGSLVSSSLLGLWVYSNQYKAKAIEKTDDSAKENMEDSSEKKTEDSAKEKIEDSSEKKVEDSANETMEDSSEKKMEDSNKENTEVAADSIQGYFKKIMGFKNIQNWSIKYCELLYLS